MTHREIGEAYKIRPSSVSKLTSDFKRSKSTIVKRRLQELKRAQRDATTIYVVNRMIEQGRSIWSTKQIQLQVAKESGLIVQPN